MNGLHRGLAADLKSGPTHAYLLTGPSGSGKRRAARSFAAELLAEASADPESARARALADPSPHPDLEWVSPPGNQHLVSEIRDRIIGAAAYRPFEGERRVFVIEDADALAEESQNALLTTLEEPPAHAHLILISADPASILPTVRSRCRAIGFAAAGEDELVARLGAQSPGAGEADLRAVARLGGADVRAAQFLLSDLGRRLRAAAERCVLPSAVGERPWLELIEIAAEAGEQAGAAVAERVDAAAEENPDERIAARIRREGEDASKRAIRRERTRLLTLGLRLMTARLRDVEAVTAGAPELLGCDRADEVKAAAGEFTPGAALHAAALAAEAQRRLRVNVSEELALEALAYGVAHAA